MKGSVRKKEVFGRSGPPGHAHLGRRLLLVDRRPRRRPCASRTWPRSSSKNY
ncbi:MAG: hypothetical protein M0C28_38785 [Candidatus Moduliflexus flocculans]|nr:hypothetical protein [Candidatus Moduliflexus flocculans]